MNDINKIYNLIKDYKVISFDVFDTLIIRDVKKPTDIFRLSYGFLGRYIRVIAEIIARHHAKNGEVSIKDIQKYCPFKLDKELLFENRYCRANPKMLELFDILHKEGKRIYAISDMYLDSEFIENLLRQSGYDVPVIVSSEYGKNKKSGELFTEFLKQNNIAADEVIHIGDSLIADVEGAHKAGIKGLLVEKHDNKLNYTKIVRKNFELASFINHGLNEIDNPVERIGYEIVGPIVLSFCQWIHKIYIDDKFDCLFFLARDMQFTYDIYSKLFKDDSIDYLYVSRKSFMFSRQQPEELLEYLKKENVFGNIAIVDAGWLGNAQVEIEKYSKMIDSKSDVGGLYLGLKITSGLKRRSTKTYCFLAPDFIWKFKCELIAPFMETLIGSNDKQVISYKDGNPVFDRDKSRDKTNLLKEGARKFISDWVKHKYNKEINYKCVRKPFFRLFRCPKYKDMELLGNLHYEDFKDTCIISYVDNYSYLKNIDKWFSDLSYSGWKGAFFKKSFGSLYSPFLFIYLFFNTIRNIFFDIIKVKNNKL